MPETRTGATVYLGNPAALIYPRGVDGSLVDSDGNERALNPSDAVGTLDEPTVTTIHVSPDSSLLEAVAEVAAIWRLHASDGPPSWVESNDPALESLLCAQLGCSTTGRPKTVEKTHHTPDGPPGTTAAKGGTLWALGAITAATMLLGLLWLWLRTNAGIDHQSRVTFDTASNGSSSYAAANYIALTENTGSPAAGDTTLTGELAAAGGGLIRAQATYAHTNGTNTTTLTKTFTANANDSLPKTPAKAGLFNASSSGTMAYETAIPSPPAMGSVGDQITITWTFTF